MVYTEMLTEDRIALHSGNCTIKTKLIVSPGTSEQIILTEQDAIKSWEHTEERYVPDVGFVGQFIARELTGELHNTSEDFNIENKIVELRFAVVRNDEVKTETWYSLGKFVVMQPEDDEVNDNTTFEAFDLTTLFNIEFDANYTDDTFKKSFADTIAEGNSFTALMLAKYTCNQVGIDLETSFTNNMFEITSNQFTEGDSCRDVLKAIAQLAFGWCRIGWDNKLYIETISTDVSNISETEILTNNQYYSLTTQKEYFGPVNRVYIGPSMIEGEGVVTDDNESTEANGDIVINVYDNPITYTHELRKLALKNADKLFGLKYIPFETETVGHPWYKASKPIIVVDMEGNEKQTYPFSVVTKYTGHIKTTISAVELTQAQKENGYDKSIYKDITKVKIEVDKSKQEIRAVAESVEYKTTPTAKMSGSKITFNDGTVAPLIDFQIEGKSVQETRSGKNLLPNTATNGISNNLTFTINPDKSIHITGTSTARTLFNININKPITLKNNVSYILSKQGDDQYCEVYLRKSSTAELISSMNSTVTSKKFTNTYTDPVFCYIAIPANVTLDVTLSLQLEEEGTVNTDYEPYGISPSPDYPSEIESVGYENIFDFETFKSENSASITGDADNFELSVVDQSMKYYFGEENKQYTISGTWYSTRRDGVLNIYYTDGTKENIIAYYDAISQSPTNFNFTTSKDKTVDYIKFTTYSGNFTFENFIISEGTQQHSYIPYSKYGIEVEIVGKNLFDKGKLEQNGISTTGEEIDNAYIVRTDFIKVLNNVDYILSFDFNSTIGYDVRVFQYDSNKKFLKFDYTNTTKLNFKTETNAAYIRLSFYTDRQITPITYLNHFSNIQLEQNKTSTNYEEYKSSTTQFILDQPLRSLPDGTKDIVYIQNGKVYLERHIIDLTLNGTENILVGQYGTNAYKITPSLMPNNNRSNYEIMSNGFLGVSHADRANYTSNFVYVDGRDLYFRNTDFATIDEFKTYLAENNVEVQYKLATTLVKTEELGKIEMPSTFKGVTNITTTDTLEPIIHLEYVRDSNISSYVEGQIKTERVLREENVAQLTIEDNQIRESVSSVSVDLTSANTTINKVEETLTSHEKTITVISTNIDTTTGAVKEVTTTNGFTFNNEGLNIYTDQNSYNTQINNVGTYYKDGDEIVSQTTKDGSLLKNLSQQGQSQYSYDNINKEYEFVEERINVDGEYVYATFYNGEE